MLLFLLGMMVGGSLGAFCMCLFVANKDTDKPE